MGEQQLVRYTSAQLEEMAARAGPDLLADLAEAALAWHQQETDETRYKLMIATALYWRKWTLREMEMGNA